MVHGGRALIRSADHGGLSALEQVNAAIDELRTGKAIRSVIRFPNPVALNLAGEPLDRAMRDQWEAARGAPASLGKCGRRGRRLRRPQAAGVDWKMNLRPTCVDASLRGERERTRPGGAGAFARECPS